MEDIETFSKCLRIKSHSTIPHTLSVLLTLQKILFDYDRLWHQE